MITTNRMDKNKEITIGIRLTSMIIDHFVMSVTMIIPIIPFFIVGMNEMSDISQQPIHFKPLIIFGFILAFAIYFNKDFFNGRSPAKRFLNLQVLNNKTNEVSSSLRCLVRNLTIPIWPIEIVFILINPKRRLGDYIAGTKIEFYSNERTFKRKEVKDYIISIVIGLGFTYLIISSIDKLNKSNEEFAVNYIKTSLNKGNSVYLSSFLTQKLRYYSDSVNVMQYDKVENDSLKYISLLFYLKYENRNIIYSPSRYDSLTTKIIDNLSLELPSNSFILKGKIICLNARGEPTRYMFYDLRKVRNRKFGKDWNYINDSTKILKSYFENGQLESEATYVHGKLFSTYREWFENGMLKTEINYINGQRNGLTYTWYSNGQKESEVLYKNNNYVNTTRMWDINGKEILLYNK